MVDMSFITVDTTQRGENSVIPLDQGIPDDSTGTAYSTPSTHHSDPTINDNNRPPRPNRDASLAHTHDDEVHIDITDDEIHLRQRKNATDMKSFEDNDHDVRTQFERQEDGGQHMDIHWEDVRYSVPMGRGKNKTQKEILKGVSGRARPGELVAIMGGSGAGKSTLLNVLAGRVPVGTPTGTILANGKLRDPRQWKRVVGYVEQEDLMYENLTVRETIATAALLRLPSKQYTKAQKLQRVEDVMAQLGLSHVADTRVGNSQTGGISGGEKKRVSIGIELVTDPGTLFLDEPTTGLDSATARNICDMLKKLARRNNKTIIMTIHMPRETILDMMDQVALMSYGRMVWFGPSKDALTHFSKLGYQCPQQTNPADFFLDLIQVDSRDPSSKETSEKLLAAWQQVRTDHIQPIDPKIKEEANRRQSAVKSSKAERAKLQDEWDVGRGRWGVSWIVAFRVLLWRNLRHVWRSKTVIIAALMQQFILFLLIGFVFFRIKNDQSGVQNRYGVLFFICINQTFSFLMPIITVFPLERRIILRERAAGSYRVSAAYFAKAVSQWPLAILGSLVFSAPVYWLIGLHPTASSYILFLVITQCLVFAAQSLGLLIGSSVPNVQMAQVFGPLVVIIFVIFGGNFANQATITPVLRWIQWISIIRYAYGAYMQNEFNDLTFDCSGSTGALCVPQGRQIVDSFGLDTPSLGICILLLLCLAVAFQIGAMFMLRRTTRLRMKII
ncbi:P-loop containing nucleoside triphosphate hydrolase protein [Phlyctochytrium arcticum]|nr:P-loop containing nucleoside triphosphate hydrolase protein [Phlyctochytrium arcticum]